MYKIGEKVYYTGTINGHNGSSSHAVVLSVNSDATQVLTVALYYRDTNTPIVYGVSSSGVLFTKVESSSSAMSNLKEKFVLALLSEPEKSFRKAGITNGDNLLTSEGATIFLSWLLEENKDAFKSEVVDKLLEDKKE